MEQENITTCLRQLQNVFSRRHANDIGRAVGLFKRLRVIEPYKLLSATVGALSQPGTTVLADVQRLFNALHGESVCYKPFHKQLAKQEFADFMRESAIAALTHFTGKALAPCCDELRRFKAIYLQDGTSFAVHDGLADLFPGRFKTVSPAAVELHVRMDLLKGLPQSVTLTPDTSPERDALPEPAQIKDCLLMADRGYFERAYWHAVDAAGGAFLVKGMGRINPCVLQAWKADGSPLVGAKGRPLASVRQKLPKRTSCDLDVCWEYAGGSFRCRLISRWNAQRKSHEFLVTNLPRQHFDLNAIEYLYRLRWQIELLFKEWKSFNTLKRFNTQNPAIVEGMIWASLIALCLKRFLTTFVQQTSGIWLSTLTAAKTASIWLMPIIQFLTSGKTALLKLTLTQASAFLQANSRRAHPQRDKATGLARYGVEPCLAMA